MPADWLAGLTRSQCARAACRLIATGCVAVSWVIEHGVTLAADYPSRPIRLVVPFASGSNIDLTARQIVPRLSESLGQQIVVDNRAGAGGTIGASIVARAVPDGYTILMGNAPTHGMAPTLYKNLAYDPVKSFAPIARTDTESFVLAVSSTIPVTSVAELIAQAKARPGKLNYASSGNGTTAHLSGTLFGVKAGIDIRHVPYNSVPQAMIDMATGRIEIMFYSYQALTSVIQNGKVRVIATTGRKRAAYLPALPTMIESGIDDFIAMAWHGFYAPAGTSASTVEVLHAALVKTVADPKVAAGLASSGCEVDVAGPAEFAAFTKGEVERYRALIALAGSKVD